MGDRIRARPVQRKLGDNKIMKTAGSYCALVIGVIACRGLFAESTASWAPVPEVLVTTVRPQDVPRVLERVATLGMASSIANINAQVQGYIVFARLSGGPRRGKEGYLLFQIDPRPFEAALAQAKGTLAKDTANQVESGCG